MVIWANARSIEGALHGFGPSLRRLMHAMERHTELVMGFDEVCQLALSVKCEGGTDQRPWLTLSGGELAP